MTVGSGEWNLIAIYLFFKARNSKMTNNLFNEYNYNYKERDIN